MIRRLLSAAVALPLLLLAVWMGGWLFALVVAIVATAACLEFYDLATRANAKPLATLGVALSLLFMLDAYFGGAFPGPILAFGVLACLLLVARRPSLGAAITDASVTLVGALYCGWLPSHFVLLRELDRGFGWVLATLLATFAVDTAAYFVGRALGSRRMAPRLSPGKTWEGAIGGLIAGPVAMLLLAWLLPLPTGVGGQRLDSVSGALLGLAISVVGQLGDLAESTLKRAADAKESGTFLPGHGGVLDRTDSLLFNGAMVYYVIRWVWL